ncbi:MAG: hypothetical protein GPJ54_11565 [Candidatus Heimdallarchaeota archaeon]|nr:hypothetical protein [Candidatus Heimdallarchaeota archaeon]
MLALTTSNLISHKRNNCNLIQNFLDDFDTFFNSQDMAAFSPDLFLENLSRDEIQLLRTEIRKMGEKGRKTLKLVGLITQRSVGSNPPRAIIFFKHVNFLIWNA